MLNHERLPLLSNPDSQCIIQFSGSNTPHPAVAEVGGRVPLHMWWFSAHLRDQWPSMGPNMVVMRNRQSVLFYKQPVAKYRVSGVLHPAFTYLQPVGRGWRLSVGREWRNCCDQTDVMEEEQEQIGPGRHKYAVNPHCCAHFARAV